MNRGARCDSEMTLEEKRNVTPTEDSLHHGGFRARRWFAPGKSWVLRDPLQPHREGDGGGYDHLLAKNEEPPAGAHLVTPRIGYVHHGIYLGAGKVIHSGAVSGLLPRGPVEEVSLQNFSHGRRVWVRSGLPARFTPQQVVDRARSRLGEDRYHLLSNNCEHLCEWCLRGIERSYQVERLMSWLRFWHVGVQGTTFPFKRLTAGID